jgi:hypothetical protein
MVELWAARMMELSKLRPREMLIAYRWRVEEIKKRSKKHGVPS